MSPTAYDAALSFTMTWMTEYIIDEGSQSFFKRKTETFAGFSFLNLMICCSYLSFMIINAESLDFVPLVGGMRKLQDVALDAFNNFLT